MRDVGEGAPLMLLHGGWGYEFYPWATDDLARDHRILAPDRAGYGKSGPGIELSPHFHAMQADAMVALLDIYGVERAALWGHSDGAVIATLMALRHPERVSAVVAEANHFDREKPRSRDFFHSMASSPDDFGERVTAKLAAEHGDPYWRDVLREGGKAWLMIAVTPQYDFYPGLENLSVPLLALHGTDDPRTEPGELDRLARETKAEIHWVKGGGHSPHTEPAVAAEANRVAAEFLRAHR
jgi:pimeloyl-ACP methyl ester carboxylesterase